MEIFRYTRDMYGQETLQGISWDLIPLFAGTAALIIVCHLAYSFVANKK